jgi:nucleotide-binding universal stress UspA family protein
VIDELIVETAREEGASYIVIGTHGRSGIARFMLGSVADRVVRTASCPVLTVRPRAACGTARLEAT